MPPEEKFWKRYSPHHELPLAGMTSLCLHGVVLAFLVLGGLAFFFGARDEASQPPSLELVAMAPGGNGLEEGAQGTSGTSGDPGGEAGKTETAPQPMERGPEATEPVKAVKLDFVPQKPLEVPAGAEKQTKVDEGNVEQQLQAIEKAAQDSVARGEAAKVAAAKAAQMAAAKVGKGQGPGGQGGNNGSGPGGVGKGTGKQGTGIGSGAGGFRKATPAEIKAMRWRFDLSGTGGTLRHADKLAAVGFLLAFEDGRSTDFLVVQDLRRRPVEVRRVNPDTYQDAVKWKNESPQSVLALKNELNLKFFPTRAIIMAPKELEQRMADEEANFARQKGRDPQTIRLTSFDFQLMDGRFQPVVLRQE